MSHPRCSRFAHWLGRSVMRVAGWQVTGAPPEDPRMVIIAAPHTSNWDLIFLLGAAYSLNLSVNWLGKDSIFSMGAGPLMRFLGGIPVDRSKSNNAVANLVQEINGRTGCAVVVPPSGTRGRTEYWKSGFYWIASDAGIPMVCGFLDYDRKVAGLGPVLRASGDMKADMDIIREFYAPIAAKFPAKKSVIRLRDED